MTPYLPLLGARRRAPLVLAVALALCAFLGAAPPAGAKAPPLRGAAIHPLWQGATNEESIRELDMLKEAGGNAVRVDLSWSSLQEQGPGTYRNWVVAKADAFFEAARERDIAVVLTFWTSPCWASSAPEDLKQGCTGAWWDRGVTRYPPSDPEQFADAAAWVATRWGDSIAALEIWNEPNLEEFFKSPYPEGDYAQLLRATYPKVKAVAPSLPILAPGIAWADDQFVERMYDEGVQPYFDAFSMRPFNSSTAPYDTGPPGQQYWYIASGVPWIRDMMIAHGDGHKKMWFTEFGWGSCAPTGWSRHCVTLETQAEYAGDVFRLIRDRWDYVEAALIYNLRNKGTDPALREHQMGMLFNDFSPKPAWEAFTTVMGELAGRPSVRTGDATEVTTDAATMRGTVNPNDSTDTTWWFEYGTSDADGSRSPAQGIQPGHTYEPVSADLSGLEPGATYHYRLVAESGAGRSYGPDRAFTTATVPASQPARISGLRVSPRRVTRARGATVRFRLSAAVDVRFTVERIAPGRRVGTTCRALSRARPSSPCRARVRVGAFQRSPVGPTGRYRLPRRLLRALRPGVHRVVATVDGGGGTGARASAGFRVVR